MTAIARSHGNARWRLLGIAIPAPPSVDAAPPISDRVTGEGLAAPAATRLYLASRGLDHDNATAQTPLLASLNDAMSPITYSALHQTFTRFVRRAAASLPPEDRRHLKRSSAHWLRHTHAMRAAEHSVPLDVLQANLGQADPRTTARYYTAQLDR